MANSWLLCAVHKQDRQMGQKLEGQKFRQTALTREQNVWQSLANETKRSAFQQTKSFFDRLDN